MAAEDKDAQYVLATRGYCPWTLQVSLALHVKGVPFELLPVASGDAAPDWFRKVSPENTVPVLLRRDASGNMEPVCEPQSKAILAYVDTTHPEPPLNRNKEESKRSEVSYADMDSWCEFVAQQIQPAVMKVQMASPFPMQHKWQGKLIVALGGLEAGLRAHNPEIGKAGGPYFYAGGRMSMVDIMLAPFLTRLPQLEYFRDFELPAAFEALTAYVKGALASPAFVAQGPKPSALREVLIKKISMLGPLSATRLQHSFMRLMLEDLISQSEAAVAALDADSSVAGPLDKTISTFKSYRCTIEHHSVLEDTVVYKVLEEMEPGITDRFSKEHEHEIPELENVQKLLTSANDLPVGDDGRLAAVRAAAARMVSLQAEHEAHFVGEEKTLFPFVKKIPKSDHAALFVRALSVCRGEPQSRLLPIILNRLPAAQAYQYLYNFYQVSETTGDDSLIAEAVSYLKAGAADGRITAERLAYFRERLPALVARLGDL